MIKLDELDNVYDQGVGPGDPTPVIKPRKAAKLQDLDSGPTSSFDFSRGSEYDPREYTKYMPEGLYEQMGDPNLRRGERQSAWDKWGNMLVGGVMKIGTSFAENIGYLGSMVGMKGDNEDYSNALTDAAKEASAWVDKQFPMYRKNNDTFGLTDAAWWTQNIQNLGVSATGFALEGIGFAKVFGMLGKATEALGGGVRAMKVANKATELLTSGALAYTEGAQMGKEVYDKTYNTQVKNYLRSGMSLSEADAAAKHIAAQSAATTVQLNTMINTGLNLEMLSGLFKHKNEDAIRSWWVKSGKQAEGEAYESFASRIRNTSVMDKKVAKEIFKHEGLKHYAESALSEGIEELTNNFAQKTGEDLGQQWDDKTRSGRTKGVFDQLGELSHYFDRTMDADGALSFVLGAVGGVAQGAILNNVPIHKVNKVDPTTGKPIELKSEDGTSKDDNLNKQFETKRVSAREKGKYYDRQYFNNVQKAIVADLDFIDGKKSAIEKARAAGQHDKADALSDELFHTMNFNAVHMGMATNYANTYREIAATDNTTPTRDAMLPQMAQMDSQLQQMEDGPEKEALTKQRADLQQQYDKAPVETEAMKRGYAKDATDNAYKKKAEEAIATLQELENIHAKVQAKYQGSDNPVVQDFADIVSNRKMALYIQAQRIKRLQDTINGEDLEQMQQLADVGTVDTHDTAVIKARKDLQLQVETEARLVQQYNTLVEARRVLDTDPTNKKAQAVVDNMIRKFSALGRTSADDFEATNDILDRLRKRIAKVKEDQKKSQDDMFNSSGYQAWIAKNPGKKFEDYTEAVAQKHGLEKEALAKRAFLNEQKMEHEEGSRNLMELETERGTKRMKAKAEAFYKELDKQEEAKRQKDITEAVKRARSLVASQKNLLRQKNRLQAKYHEEILQLQEKYDKSVERLAEINHELQELTDGKVPTFSSEKALRHWEDLIHQKRDIEASIARTETRLVQLQSLYQDVTAEIRRTEEFLDTDEPVEVKNIVPDNDVTAADSTPVADDGTDEAIIPDAMEESEPQEEPTDVNPTASTNAATAIETAAKNYHYELSLLPTAISEKVQAYAKELLASGAPVNFDYLIADIKAKKIDTDDAAEVLQALKEYLDAKRAMDTSVQAEENAMKEFSTTTAENVATNGEQLAAEEPFTEEDPYVEEPDTDVTSLNFLLSIRKMQPGTSMADTAYHGGLKTVNIIKVNTLGLEYLEYFDEKTGEYQKMSDIHNLNKNLNPDVQNPKKLGAGTQVFLAVDTEYDGKTNYDYSLETDEYGDRSRKYDPASNYLTDDKKVKEGSHENVPIKIMDASGKTIGWLPRTDWLNARYPGTEGDEAYRNIVAVTYDEEGNPVDNLTEQQKQLHDVRTAIVEAHNEGRGKVMTTITEKGAGMLTFNREVNKNTEKQKEIKWDKASKLLEDPTLKLAVVRKDKAGNLRAFWGKNEAFPGQIVTDLEAFEGMPVAILPAPNGQFHIAPLAQTAIAGKDSSPVEFNTLVRAIEVFLGSHSEDADIRARFEKEAATIEDGTGFNVRTEAGLRDYINQYHTYTQHFRDEATTAVAGEHSKMKFVFTIDDKVGNQTHGDIRIGTTFSGRQPLRAGLVGGKLDPKFVTALKDGVGKRPRNVVQTQGRRKGLNSKGEFRGAKVNSAGVWSFKKYPSYNEFLKDHTTTNIVGTNKLGSQYVYAVHPQIQMDVNKIIGKPKVIIASTSIPDVEAAKATPTGVETAAERRRKRQMALVPDASSKPVTIKNELGLEAKPGMTAVSYDALEKLRNLAGENWNGKTVETVLEDLQRQNLPYIADKYNPFSECK